MNKVDLFFEFELKNNLFDYVDNNGIRPWDTIRMYVFNNIVSNTSETNKSENRKKRERNYLGVLRLLILDIIYLLTHLKREYIFILTSRGLKDGKVYDTISDGVYSLVNKSKVFSIETYVIEDEEKYAYNRLTFRNVLFVLWCKLYRIRCQYDLTYIYGLLKQSFKDFNMDIEELRNHYTNAILQYSYYKLLFRMLGTQKIFMTQNNIQKGLFAAARKLGIEIYEFQHGQISRNHTAYSYPSEIDLCPDKIHHPDILLTFGDFWSKNRHYPGVQNIVLGNDNYIIKNNIPDTSGNKKLLVVSNHDEGELLAQQVLEVLKKKPELFFYFKLHPNQFNELDYYRDLFKDNDRVEVISGQHQIKDYLIQCEGIFLYDSTVELEALHMGRKVFVIKEQFYEIMDFVFDESGVFVCQDVDDFIKQYDLSQNMKLSPRNDLFSPFNHKVAEQLLVL